MVIPRLSRHDRKLDWYRHQLFDNFYSPNDSISNMKVIGLIVDFKQIVKLGHLSSSMVSDNFLPLTIELNT